jgi:predicted lipoprotein
MHTFIKLILLATCVSLIVACGRSPEQQMLTDTGQGAILPLHENFLAESLSFSQATSAYCALAERSELDLAVLKGRWIATMNAWEGIQSFQFGPIAEDNQAWKIQFWPDRKNLISRKTEQFVKRDNAITLSALQNASVVVQGLSAAEYLLYDTPADQLHQTTPSVSRYCAHLHAAAQNLHQVADFLYSSWQPSGGNYLKIWSKPGPSNLSYPDEQASIASVIETLVYGLERIKRDKLELPLALLDQGQANTYLLEWWRSKQSREAILINLHSLQLLFNGGTGEGLAMLLKQRDGEVLADNINNLFDRAVSVTASIEGSLFDNHNDSDTQLAIIQLHGLLGELLGALKREVPAKLNITLGFNANDGD